MSHQRRIIFLMAALGLLLILMAGCSIYASGEGVGGSISTGAARALSEILPCSPGEPEERSAAQQTWTECWECWNTVLPKLCCAVRTRRAAARDCGY